MKRAIVLALLLMAVTSTIAFASPNYDQSPFAICGLGLMFGREHPNWDGWSKEAANLKAAGITWVRFDLWWGVVEPEKDKFDWSYTDKMAKFYRDNSINAMPILCYGSSWYGKPPDNDEERARYANYVYHVVDRYKDTFKVWEIWNEPNIPSLWKNPNIDHYTKLLIEAYKAAKKADPNCIVLGGAANGADMTWIKGIYDHGGWDYCDAISVHPYTMGGTPVEMRLDKIERILNGYIASTGKPKPLWISEMGWTAEKPDQEQDQAINMFETYVISMANGLEKVFWFCANDFNEKWGITRGLNPLSPKLAYGTYRLMTSKFGSPGPAAKFEGYLSMPQGVVAYVFSKPSGERLIVCWSIDGKMVPAQIGQSSGLTAVDIFGKAASVSGGRFVASKTPILISGGDAKLIGAVSKTADPLVEPKGKNLCDNPSCDSTDGKTAWGWQDGRFHHRLRSNGTYEVSKDGRNSTTCVSISNSHELASWENHLIPVFPGTKLKMTGWIKTKDATGDNGVALVWYTGEGWTAISDFRSKTITGTHDWQKVTVEGTVPANIPFMRPNLMSVDNSGTVWFDDVELVEE